MTEIMPVPRKIILLSYQQGANVRPLFAHSFPSASERRTSASGSGGLSSFIRKDIKMDADFSPAGCGSIRKRHIRPPVVRDARTFVQSTILPPCFGKILFISSAFFSVFLC